VIVRILGVTAAVAAVADFGGAVFCCAIAAKGSAAKTAKTIAERRRGIFEVSKRPDKAGAVPID